MGADVAVREVKECRQCAQCSAWFVPSWATWFCQWFCTDQCAWEAYRLMEVL